MISFSKKEKFTIYDDKGLSIEISVNSPFYLDDSEGIENMENDIFTTKNYSDDGEIFLSSQARPRNIIFNGRIRFNKDVHRPQLIHFFKPHKEYTIEYTNKDITRYIKARLERTPTINKEVFPEFMISFLCTKPYWFEREYKADIALWRGAFQFPLEIPKDIGIQMGYREPSLIVNINNVSDSVMPMRIIFKAYDQVVSPSIFNLLTREQILVEYTMVRGDEITINTELGNESVVLTRDGIETNIFNYLTIDSNPQMQLDFGDNLLRYGSKNEAELKDLDVSIYYTPKYVGV